VHLDPGVERFAAYAKRGCDFRFSASLGGEFESALTIGGIVERGPSARSQRQDFWIGAHITSQVLNDEVCGRAQRILRLGSEPKFFRLFVRMLFCDYTDL
jgi:hypothetical protein